MENINKELMTINFTPSRGEICLAIPDEVRKVWAMRDKRENQGENKIILSDDAIKKMASEIIKEQLFYTVIEVCEDSDYKVGQCVMLREKPDFIKMKDGSEFFMTDEGNIRGKMKIVN